VEWWIGDRQFGAMLYGTRDEFAINRPLNLVVYRPPGDDLVLALIYMPDARSISIPFSQRKLASWQGNIATRFWPNIGRFNRTEFTNYMQPTQSPQASQFSS